jgi:hypothetical protein
MTIFLRLMKEQDKQKALISAIGASRADLFDDRVFQANPDDFKIIPGAPFAYWVNHSIRSAFTKHPRFESEGRTAKQGLATADDYRFLRVWWEVKPASAGWYSFAKGGSHSQHYADVYLMVNWADDGAEIKNNLNEKGGIRSNVWMLKDTAPKFFFRPGLTWPLRTNGLSFRAIPSQCIFGHKGPVGFGSTDDESSLLELSAVLNSSPFVYLVSLQLARTELAQSFEVGLIQQTPVPELGADQRSNLATLARRAWSLKRTLDTITETSHAFLLPATLRARTGNYDPPATEVELVQIQAEIDSIAFELYGFSEADRQSALGQSGIDPAAEGEAENKDEEDGEEDSAPAVPALDAMLSWGVGVAFGRFDWRLATGERAASSEPEPFDPLPAKSPGMLPDGAAPFHVHPGILVDDPGHPDDLARLVEEVLTRVDAPVPGDVRRWLQREFFAFHLQRYSKSRRKAPIYWPISTVSGGYTLWVYYPSLSSQTLYTAINDLVEPKLKQLGEQVTGLRNKGSSRTSDDERQFEALQTFEFELIELRDALLKLAPSYKPHHDDGVQISAAPLWPLFRHKPWQKILKDTWAKLEKGDYDWAHLAMNYWPERVRDKCKTDKSLAIAHGLEELYVEPEAKPKKARGRKKAGEDS